MVVMGVLAHHLEPSLSVAELARRRQARVGEELERTVDGGVADTRAALAHLAKQVLDRDVAARAQEQVHNHVALVRRLETMTLDVLVEARAQAAALGCGRGTFHFASIK